MCISGRHAHWVVKILQDHPVAESETPAAVAVVLLVVVCRDVKQVWHT